MSFPAFSVRYIPPQSNGKCGRSDRAVLVEPMRVLAVISEDHVRDHVFLCMLAYYVQWHMRQRLAPLLFEDDDRPAARASRETPLEKAEVSPSAERKADTKRTPDGFPVHSFATLLDDLSGVALNKVRLPGETGIGTGDRHATDPPPGPGLRAPGRQSQPICSHRDDRVKSTGQMHKLKKNNELSYPKRVCAP